MDPRKKKRLKAKMRVTALITAAYQETAHKSKKRSCWRYCGWPQFGYGAFVVMLCLGITLIILGGVFTKIDLYILGGVFVVGSLIFLIMVCAPGENCGRNKRVVGDASAEVKQEVVEMESETPRPVRKPLQFTGKKLSFLRSVLGNAVQQETVNRRLSSDVQNTDRSWVKMVENQQAMYRKTKATIEEEPKRLSEFQNDTKEEPGKDSKIAEYFQNNTKDDIKIENETINAPGTVNDPLSDSKDDFTETTTTDNNVLRDREDEEQTPGRSDHRMYRDIKEESPSKVHTVSLKTDVYRNDSSSQITEVSVHTDPHIRVSKVGEITGNYANVPDIEEPKADNTEKVLIRSEERTDLESGHKKKKRKKKKRKKQESDSKEETDFIKVAYDFNENCDSTVNDTYERNFDKKAFDHSVSRDTLQRLDTDLM